MKRFIRMAVVAIFSQQEKIMSTVAELKSSIDAVQAGVASLGDRLAAQSKSIADLQAQLTAGGQITAADLDPLKAEADDIVAKVQALQAPTA